MNFDFLPLRWPSLRQVITVHDLLLTQPIGDAPAGVRLKCRAMVWALPAVDQIFVVSDYTRRSLPKHSRRRARVQLIGIDPALSADLAATAEPTLLFGGTPFYLYPGGAHRRKRTDFLLESFNEYRMRSGQAILVSTARLTSSPPDWLRCVPGASNQQLAQLYRGSRGVIYPSQAEGYGLPLLEAAAAGVPALVTSSLPAAEEDPACVAALRMPDDASALEWALQIGRMDGRIHPIARWTDVDNHARWLAYAEACLITGDGTWVRSS
jgi:glycosyltransferase involved in cell wall biosynthesis